MSRENVEIVRRVYEALSCRDTDAVVALYDPEVETVNVSGDRATAQTDGGSFKLVKQDGKWQVSL